MVQAVSIPLLQFPATAKAAFPHRRLFMEDAAAAPSLGSHPESWSILDGCWPEDESPPVLVFPGLVDHVLCCVPGLNLGLLCM
ncbi:hypothetical protein V6N11_015152 [Hibiscus sabdariffa]|uniref:Uncharacterized protein n=1 Tax=Hibiscus sabdariffa TaxID=183260 RepID=A0ABR2TR86_9ROSI